jgi:hypothetical protein
MAGVLRMYTPSPSVLPTYTVFALAAGGAALVGAVAGVPPATGLATGLGLASTDGEAATEAADDGVVPPLGVGGGDEPVPGSTPHPALNTASATTLKTLRLHIRSQGYREYAI